MISQRIIDKYQQAHDARLDAAAKEKRYDSIQSAALRAAFLGPFHDEGVAFAEWMDTCNALGYQIMSEIEQGIREPLSIEEYLSLLPELVLP